MIGRNASCIHGALIVVLASISAGAVAQQPYPGRLVRIVTPFAAGSSTSTLTFMVAKKLSERVGQTVVADTRPGGNTILGTEAVARAAPDGYTIALVTSSFVIVPILQAAPYDVVKDFAPIGTIASTEFVLALHPSLPARNLKEFIALAKARPGELNYSTSGSGTFTHLTSEMFSALAGIRMQHIPYKGSGPAVTDLIGGQVQVSMQAPVIVIQHVKSGKLRAIAISGDSRLPAIGDVPTFTQAGLPGYDAKLWFGILGPAGTPKAIVDRLSAEFTGIMAVPAFREELVSQGMDPFVTSPEQFAALIRTDTNRFAKIIKAGNIKAD
jgi:tripartite-type tricarboxylate transporter receptor subunit TctC